MRRAGGRRRRDRAPSTASHVPPNRLSSSRSDVCMGAVSAGRAAAWTAMTQTRGVPGVYTGATARGSVRNRSGGRPAARGCERRRPAGAPRRSTASRRRCRHRGRTQRHAMRSGRSPAAPRPGSPDHPSAGAVEPPAGARCARGAPGKHDGHRGPRAATAPLRWSASVALSPDEDVSSRVLVMARCRSAPLRGLFTRRHRIARRQSDWEDPPKTVCSALARLHGPVPLVR